MISFLLALSVSFSNLALGCNEVECSAYAPVSGNPTFYGCAATAAEAKAIAKAKCQRRYDICVVDGGCRGDNPYWTCHWKDNIDTFHPYLFTASDTNRHVADRKAESKCRNESPRPRTCKFYRCDYVE